jgi:hypothetical protein
MARRRGALTREEKLENVITNHSLIFMGMFEEGLTALAERIADPSSGARGSRSAGSKPKDELAPEVRAQIADVFSSMREEGPSELTGDARAFKRYVSGPAFDKGLEIVEKYDFGRPKLTERLTDDVLASYVFLLLSGDGELSRMFKEIAEWKAGLPEPPWAG